MSPISWPVVTGTLLVGSPAIYAAQVAGTLSPDAAMVRLLLCAIGVWAVCSMFSSFSTQAVEANQAQQRAAEQAAAKELALKEKAARDKAAAEAAADESAA
jgi:cytochrome bd-type quinol oxidase subunit 2